MPKKEKQEKQEKKPFDKAFPKSSKILEGNSTHDELVNVLEFLGRKHTEGDVAGDHLSRILEYLIRQQQEEYKKTVSKLALLIGIGQRYVKENYLEGLEAFDIIEIRVGSKWKIWTWRGIKDI